MVVQEKTPPPRLLEIAGIMAREGSLTFGGGGPTTIALEKALVHGKAWLSRARFRLAYALSRFTPGTNVFAFCTALGWQMRGIPGAMVALIGASVPCSVVTIAITVLLQIWQDNPSAAVALQVASAVAIGLVAASCWPLVRPHVRKRTWARTLVLLGGAIALQFGWRSSHSSSARRRSLGRALEGAVVNVFALYLLLLKATISAFSGLSALPIIRDELVVNRHVLTDAQMNTALVAGRVSPGPIGMYVISIGYTVAGAPGALAAWLALITPALIVIPLLRYIGARAEHPVVHAR